MYRKTQSPLVTLLACVMKKFVKNSCAKVWMGVLVIVRNALIRPAMGSNGVEDLSSPM